MILRMGLPTVAVLLSIAGGASAQSGIVPATSRPAVSPYLNLLRPGNSPGVNYYGLVRPQLEFQNGLRNLQQQVQTNETAIAGLNKAILPTTGHTSTFLNTGGYYSGGAGTNGGGSAPRAPGGRR